MPAFQADGPNGSLAADACIRQHRAGVGVIAALWFDLMMLRVYHSCLLKSVLISEYILES
jgi:hypothetical protein